MRFYTEWKEKGTPYGNGFANGLTMSAGDSTKGMKEVASDSEKTVFACENGCSIECWHIPKGNVVECFSVFKNTSAKTVSIEHITSFALGEVCADKIHRIQSFWSAEGRLLSQSLVDLNMERSWSGHGIRVEKFGQIGSMPVRKWFPFVALENSEKGEFIGVQLYCASSWQIELFRYHDPLTLCGGLADFDYGHWSKDIAPGESFTTPKAVVATGSSLEEVCNKLVKAQQPRIAKVDEDMPVIYNEYCTTWGNPTRENLEKIAKRLEGSGIKYLVIDSGWYKEDGKTWFNTIGDWNVSAEMFPKGLKETADMIRSYGMIPGLWFEMECTAPEAEAYAEEEHHLRRDGVPVTVGNHRFWDMRDPWVMDYLTEKVIGTLKAADMGYIKVDYNDNIGVGCDGAESLGEGLRMAVEGSREFFKKMAAELPELVIENCSSGGHRLEPSVMELCSMASFSDAHECLSIPLIAANLQRVIRPEQSQIWAVLRGKDSMERLNYSLAAGFLGRLCLSGEIFDLSEEAWSHVKAAIAFYARVKHIIKDGYTQCIRTNAISYNNPVGSQAVMRVLGNEALLVVHTFKDGASPAINDLLEGYEVKESFGSELDADFCAKVFWLEKKN